MNYCKKHDKHFLGKTIGMIVLFIIFINITSFVFAQEDSRSISFPITPRSECTKGELLSQLEGGIWKVYECDGFKFSILKYVCGPNQELKQDSFGRYIGCKDNGGDSNLLIIISVLAFLVIISFIIYKIKLKK